jgi:hypothetical protein
MRHAPARNDARETMGMDAGARGGKRKAAYIGLKVFQSC